jgi:cytochrome c oxidase subunit 3
MTETTTSKMHPHKFTLWVAMGSLIMMFAGLTSAFIVKSNQASWKPVTLPTVFWLSTVAIVISSATMYLAVRAIRAQHITGYRLLLLVTLLLGTAFLWFQWQGFEFLWSQQVTFRGSGAGQFLYVIFGLHGLHVIGGLVTLLVILIKSFLQRSKIYSSVPAEIAATYWHFVDLLWIYLLVFFLLIGQS